MSKTGHAVTALALAAAAVVPERNAAHIAFAIGVMLGASGPDFLEFVYAWRRDGWGGRGDERLSLIPHRTLTHSPFLWLAVVLVAARFGPTPIDVLGVVVAVPITLVIAGFAASCLLHIAIDLLSPMGIPLLSPFGSRTSVGWSRNRSGRSHCYTTGAASEIPIMGLVIAAAAAWCFVTSTLTASGVIARL